MIVRKIREDEVKRVQEFCAIAFEYSMDNAKSPQEYYEEIKSNPQSRQDLFCQSQWAAFLDDGRTMLSTFTVVPYPAHFDGHQMLMMGIGGVSTLPQYRRNGGVRACFEKALPDMYEQGAAFSYLYPFSTAYYRKFGYEMGCEGNLYKLLLSGIPKHPLNGRCELLEPGVDLKNDIRHVYRFWQTHYNLMTMDEDIEYLWVDKANPFKDQEYTYLYRSVDGSPKGYVSIKLALEADERNLRCTRICFVDIEGFYGILNLILSLAADHRYVTFRLPPDVELVPLLPEWCMGVVECKREFLGMVRVVNVEKALSLARMRGDGDIVLDISDGQIPQNNGRFEAVFANGAVSSVRRTERTADLSMNIQDFSRLIVGRYDVDALPYLTDVASACSLERAGKVFYRKPLFITRYF